GRPPWHRRRRLSRRVSRTAQTAVGRIVARVRGAIARPALRLPVVRRAARARTVGRAQTAVGGSLARRRTEPTLLFGRPPAQNRRLPSGAPTRFARARSLAVRSRATVSVPRHGAPPCCPAARSAT